MVAGQVEVPSIRGNSYSSVLLPLKTRAVVGSSGPDCGLHGSVTSADYEPRSSFCHDQRPR